MKELVGTWRYSPADDCEYKIEMRHDKLYYTQRVYGIAMTGEIGNTIKSGFRNEDGWLSARFPCSVTGDASGNGEIWIKRCGDQILSRQWPNSV